MFNPPYSDGIFKPAQLGQALAARRGSGRAPMTLPSTVSRIPQFDQKRLGSGLLGVRRLGKWVYEPWKRPRKSSLAKDGSQPFREIPRQGPRLLLSDLSLLCLSPPPR